MLRKSLSVRELLDALYCELSPETWAHATIGARLGMEPQHRRDMYRDTGKPLEPGIDTILELALLGVAVRELSMEAARLYAANNAKLSFPIGGEEHPSNRAAAFIRSANADELAELERRSGTHASELLNTWLDTDDGLRPRKLEYFRSWRADLSSMAYVLGLVGRGELLIKRLREVDCELAHVEPISDDEDEWSDEVAFWAVHDVFGWWCPAV